MNLIANSGIQLLTIPIKIDLNNNFRMFFHEWFDINEKQLKLEIAHHFSSDEIWVKKRDLSYLGFAVGGEVTDSWEDIKDDFEDERYLPISTNNDNAFESGCFSESINKLQWDKFENTWLPMPFFALSGKRSEFGPTNWSRFKLIPVSSKNNEREYNLLMAFDTRTIFEKEDYEDEDLNETPVFTNTADKSKEFALCNNEYHLLSYCSSIELGTGWIDNYLIKLYHNVDDISELKGKQVKTKYLAQFIYLIKYIQQFCNLPTITLFSDQSTVNGNVDLVIDIGNSRTCAVLYDESDFTKLSPLELQDFTIPVHNNTLNKYKDSFDMRLAFREADLGGNFGLVNSKQFVFPSMMRLGKEANSLIHRTVNMNTGADKTSTFSSPKRFLWDTKQLKKEWEYVQLEGDTARPIFIDGVSQQLNSDGSLNIDGNGDILMQYSRQSLMTFAFLEILAQAKMQINSYEQRKHWGNESMPRRVNRIIVTCPTAMSRVEQTALRGCAEDAAIILDRFYNNTYNKKVDKSELLKSIQIVPSAKSIKQREERTEWIYDEATASQFMFLYAEIKERYNKNIKDYFDFYGKVRTDLEGYDKKTLTIGSVDIGAGTTDVMIASYMLDDISHCSLTPVPIFWESFYTAGDDLLKKMVQQLVVEGIYSPIEQKLIKEGKQPIEFLQPFFGTDNGVSFQNRQLRNDFNMQISIPIVTYFLELTNKDKITDKEFSYSDIFDNNPPNNRVIDHFDNHFGFSLKSLKWRYKKDVIKDIIEQVFDTLIGKISSLFSFYECDIVLLSGRPTSLKPLSDIFLKYYAISPNRLKSMNEYRVGQWYPEDKRHKFIDGNGNFINPKSIITTGAMIGHLASNGGLNGFSLNLHVLKEKLLPTTNYFGVLNEDTLDYLETIISPDTNNATVTVQSLPFRIGARQIDIPSYPSRPFYTLDFDTFKLEDRIKGRLEENASINEIKIAIDNEIQKIKTNMPLQITIDRDIFNDSEQLIMEDILSKDGNSLNKNFFSLQIQSMSEIDNFWLDSGIFSLKINN